MKSAFFFLGWVVTGSVLLGACGSSDESSPTTMSNITDPVVLCNTMAQLECQKIYSCITDPAVRQLAMLPATEPDCEAQLSAVLKCSQATPTQVCAVTSSYTVKQGNTCIDQVNHATCNDVTSNGTAVQKYVPACGQCVPF